MIITSFAPPFCFLLIARVQLLFDNISFDEKTSGGGRCRTCYAPKMPVATSLRNRVVPRHSAMVRVTHWITTISFFALLITGAEIVISHPRFYWGETGNALTKPLFILAIPSSRATVPTGYGFVLPDQNGWSRYLHFEAAWAVVLTGLVYGLAGFWTGHFRNHLFPSGDARTWRALRATISRHIRLARPDEAEAISYNVLQRMAYLAVIFILFPLVIWTGLAMSPSFDSAVPAAVMLLGGRQSARTLHFFVSLSLVLFLVVHVAMVIRAGFRNRMRAMITGRGTNYQSRAAASQRL